MRDITIQRIAAASSVFGMLAAFIFVPPVGAQQYSAWSSPVNLGPLVNSTASDQHPAISKDGLSLYFMSDRSGGFGKLDLYVSQRDCPDASCPWGAPVNLAALNTPFNDAAPEFSPDGHWLFFNSDRPTGSCGGRDIWASHRQDKRDDFNSWEQPINLGCILNSSLNDDAPTVFQDPQTGVFSLYFNRNYTPTNPDGPDIYVSVCTADIASCNRDQLWSAAVLVPELSSPVRDTRTAIRRRDGLEMFLTSSRPGGCGSQDLWVSTRATTDDAWSIPVNLDPIDPATGNPTCVTNSATLDGAMAISWDGTELYFFSNRPGGIGGNDLYRSTRSKLPNP